MPLTTAMPQPGLPAPHDVSRHRLRPRFRLRDLYLCTHRDPLPVDSRLNPHPPHTQTKAHEFQAQAQAHTASPPPHELAPGLRYTSESASIDLARNQYKFCLTGISPLWCLLHHAAIRLNFSATAQATWPHYLLRVGREGERVDLRCVCTPAVGSRCVSVCARTTT